MKIIKIGGNKRGVIIPKWALDKVLNWDVGQSLEMSLTNDKEGLIIRVGDKV